MATDEATQLLLDFIAADDRPTVVVRDNAEAAVSLLATSSVDLIFQNAAMINFLDLLRDSEASFHAWIDALVRNLTDQRRHMIPIPVFGGCHWSAKRLNCGWIAIHCFTETWTTAAHVKPSLETIMNDAPDLTLSDEHSETPLDQILCDWTLYPHLAVDPWARYLTEYDWSKTAIGPIATWPTGLRTRAVTMMTHPEPRCIFWGTDLKIIYNEACVLRMGRAHPACLGNPLAEYWGRPAMERHTQAIRDTMRLGRAVTSRNLEMLLDSRGFLEDFYHTLTYTPIPAPDGTFAGIQFDWTDTTAAVFHENRDAVLVKIAARAAQTQSLASLWTATVQALEEESQDICYALLFSCGGSDDRGGSGPSSFSYVAGYGIDTARFAPNPPKDLAAAMLGKPNAVHLLQSTTRTLPPDLAVDTPKGLVSHAYLVPVNSTLGAPLVHLVLGMNPRRAVDESRGFISLLRNSLLKSTNMVRLPEERRLFEQANLNLVTQLRDAQAKMERNKEAIERMGSLSPAGMFILGPRGEPQYANDRYLELLRLERNKWLSTPPGEFAYPETFEEPEKAVSLLTECLEGAPTTTRIRIKGTTDGLPRWVESMTFTETGGDGNVVSMQGWIWDISHQVFAESVKDQRLREAIEHKEATANFLDMISHEIRNPLGSILLLANEVLANLPREKEMDEGTATIKDAAETILLCAQHQKNIVDDVLELSRMDSGLLHLVLDPTDALGMTRDTLSMFTADIKAADITTNLKVRPGYEELVADKDVHIDGHRTTQVLINLLTNAIKFTKTSQRRHITVAVEASTTPPTGMPGGAAYVPRRAKKSSPDNDGGNGDVPDGPGLPEGMEQEDAVYVGFSVEDSGPGLTATELASLFRRFSQASPKTYKQYGGSGLGLFISKELVELHGGQIGVASEPGKGSTFGFYIKAFVARDSGDGMEVDGKTKARRRKSREVQVGEKVRLSRRDVHVLLVEDNQINQKVMRQQLDRIGCASVTVADHGQQALEAMEKTALWSDAGTNAPRLSIVLLDIEMPVMDGLTCVKRIRQLEKEGRLKGRVPVIALTANARLQQIDAAVAAGMDEVITKPFAIPALVGRIEALALQW